MPNGGIVDASTGAAQAIGRYFSVISVIPSSLYVVFVYVMIMSGSWKHSPDWTHAFMSLEHISIGGIGVLAFLSVGLGLVIHPIQFALVQFFEGYWGMTRIAQAIRSQRILRYRLLCNNLNDEAAEVGAELADPKPNETPARRAQLISRGGEVMRILNNFPPVNDQVMPTRLGNVLRRYEAQAGRQYNMDALQVVPHLLLVAPANHVDYVNDQRSQLDLAIRMTFISVAASATAVIFLWPYRYWVLIAVIPYVLAYLSYRGSVIAAGHYGSAFDILINLDRFILYEQLHMPLPADTTSERLRNGKMASLLGYDDAEVLSYQHPVQGNGTGAASKLRPVEIRHVLTCRFGLTGASAQWMPSVSPFRAPSRAGGDTVT